MQWFYLWEDKITPAHPTAEPFTQTFANILAHSIEHWLANGAWENSITEPHLQRRIAELNNE